jgi:Zn-finger nucleic acid-binding protein
MSQRRGAVRQPLASRRARIDTSPMSFICPTCSGAPALREFQNRLVCDKCEGMMIETADLTAAIHEIDGGTEELVVRETRDGDKPCPRCKKSMSSSVMSVGPHGLADRFLRCETDGLWVSQEAMTGAFASASRRSTPGGFAYAVRGMAPPPIKGGMAGAMGSIGAAFDAGNTTRNLAINAWRQKSTPRVHTVFVSAHKDRRLGCPSCKETAMEYCGDRWACPTCSGSFVENAALTTMVSDMTNALWDLPAVKGKPGERACPVCTTPMVVEVLEAVTIDRCTEHGVWFDEHELPAALHHAGTGEPSSAGGWIKRLFHRHGKIEDKT